MQKKFIKKLSRKNNFNLIYKRLKKKKNHQSLNFKTILDSHVKVLDLMLGVRTLITTMVQKMMIKNKVKKKKI